MNLFGNTRKHLEGGKREQKIAYNPYTEWKKTQENSLGLGVDSHIILPGVSDKEKIRLSGVKDYVEKVTGEKCTLPQHLIEDVYSMYVNRDIKKKPATKGTALKNKIIDKVYNSLTKVVTEDSPLFTSMLTREIAIYMQKVQRQLEEEEKKQQGEGEGNDEEGEGGGQGQSKGVFEDRGDDEDSDNDGSGKGGDSEDGEDESNSSQPAGGKQPSKEDAPDATHGDLDEALDKILDDTSQDLDKAIDKATKKMEDLKESLGEKAMKDLSEKDPEFLDNVDKLKDALRKVKVSKDSIKNVLVKILNESQNYFSAKYTVKEESIFESDELDDIESLELLHPVFKMAEMMEVVNLSRIYEGKIDLYLDCSGSMGAHENFDGQSIRMIDLVKGIAIILFRMDMLDKLYFFDTELTEIKNINEFTILGFNKSGGTDFDKVVKQVASNGRNSVVITDGEDGCTNYIKNIFWVGVGGTRFDSRWGSGAAFPTYKSLGQCVTYNSRNGLFDKVI